MRIALILLASLLLIQGIWFRWLWQGAYYFALLTAAIAFVPQARRARLTVPLILIWIGVWVDTLGTYYNWYGRFSWYDNFSHVIVGVFVTMLCAALLETSYPGRPALLAFTALLAGISLMTFYEFWEYAAQHLFDIRFIWGEFDTATDLGWNMLGALAGAGAARLVRK